MFWEQGILSWPKFNLSKHPTLLKKLDLTVDNEIYIYDFNSSCWDRKDVDHIMEVCSGQVRT